MNKPAARIKKFYDDNKLTLIAGASFVAGVYAVTAVQNYNDDRKQLQEDAALSKQILIEMWNTHPDFIAASQPAV